MLKKSPITISVIILLIASLACGETANIPALDPNAPQTAIVETIHAIQTVSTPTQSLAPTFTPELLTATISSSVTPESTSTPTKPQISVSLDTFCRLGPGVSYEKVGILLVGETTEIVGRDSTGLYWYVRNPDVGVDFCWMSGEYANISGNTSVLLVQTPPGAVVDFEATYSGQGQCSGVFWSDIRLKNLSGVLLKSISMVVRDTDTNTALSLTAHNFSFSDGCSPPRIVDTLVQGASILISSPEFPYNMNGHDINASITLCTELNLGGGCVTKTITYVP